VGDAIFTHESGIHVDGLSKHPTTYEGFDPAELGRARQTVLGKHSGTRSVRLAYQALGLSLDEPQVPVLLERVRRHAIRTKRSPTPAELQQFYLESSAVEGRPS
jgi:homocitrate synthase NifV